MGKYGLEEEAESNDELIDNLVDANLLKSSEMEKVFRAVDRAFYFPDSAKHKAYEDAAWKAGNLHLSSPALYAAVMEGLDLRWGMSFLNVGSGSGYLSTMCGLILGWTGVNHGIEVYAEVVKYARKKLEQFMKTSPGSSEVLFCPPEFTIGNIMDTCPVSKRYDRIYCGAGCPFEYVEHFFDMLKVGGSCIIPVGGSLVKITRLEDDIDQWEELLPVALTGLVAPFGSRVELPPIKHKSLALNILFQLTSKFPHELMTSLTYASYVDESFLIHGFILEYINNSQEPSHKFGTRIKSIIKIRRKHNDGFNDLLFYDKRRMMLWHGTKVKNLSSILEKGLTLPPSSQGGRGLLQGRAIYFADRASKSAQYSAEQRKPSPGQDGILLLCNVMVGRSHIPDNPDHKLTQPPEGFDSVTCPGRKAPSPSQYRCIDGVVFPSGESGDNQEHSNCMVEFNEYAIYDPDRININYIVHFTFTEKKCIN